MTYVPVAKRQTGKEAKEQRPDSETLRVAGARAGDARGRARDAIVTDSDNTSLPDLEDAAPEPSDELTDEQLETLVDLWAEEARATAARLWSWLNRDRGILREHPAPLLDLAAYWWRAPMAGGLPFLIWVQRVHGLTIGLAATFVGYAFAWLGQRPLRSLTFIVLFWITWRLS